MKRNDKHITIVVKASLGAISVVDVPIEDADSFSLLLSHFCRDGNVVENAEAIGRVAFGMVPGWSYDAVTTRMQVILDIKNSFQPFANSINTQ